MKNYIVFSLILSSLILTSCRKKECTDPDSLHYENNAKTDNSKCEYEGSLVLWYGQNVSEFLIHNNVSKLNFYLNEELIGSNDAISFRVSYPDCNDFENAVKVTKRLGDVKTNSFEFSVKSQNNIEIWNTSVNINGNVCSIMELGL